MKIFIIFSILYIAACNDNIYTKSWFNENCMYKTIHSIAEDKNIINCQNVCSTLVYHMTKNGREVECHRAFSWD